MNEHVRYKEVLHGARAAKTVSWIYVGDSVPVLPGP